MAIEHAFWVDDICRITAFEQYLDIRPEPADLVECLYTVLFGHDHIKQQQVNDLGVLLDLSPASTPSAA